MALQLDGFAAEAIDEEAARLGISVDELISFSVLYYLADVDSGRIARQIATSPYAGGDLARPSLSVGDWDRASDSKGARALDEPRRSTDPGY